MNVKDYISSGIIELYVMGSLSPSEIKEVDRMSASYPEVAEEILRVEEALNGYASAHSHAPRPGLRGEIMEAVAHSSNEEKGKVIELSTYSKRTFRLLAAACIISLLVSSVTIYSLYHKWKEAENRYTALLDEKNVLAQNYNVIKTSFDRTFADLSVMRDEHAKMITLQSTDSTKRYMARVYWNNKTHNSYIDVLSLPAPAPDKQYQLWALAGGKPVDAGVFNMDTIGMQHLKLIESADAWAVTLEPKGGSVSPTLNQMYLLGKS